MVDVLKMGHHKNNKVLHSLDSKHGRRNRFIKTRRIKDDYFQRVLSFSETKEKPESPKGLRSLSKEEQIEDEAYEEAMKNLNGKVPLMDVKGAFYSSLSRLNRERRG